MLQLLRPHVICTRSITRLPKPRLCAPPPSRYYTTPPSSSLVSSINRAKLLSANSAVHSSLLPSHRIIGIGSGSTVVPVVEALKELERKGGGEERLYVPTGWQSRGLIKEAGLRLGDVEDVKKIDIVFDGADDVDPLFNVIKGGGACLLREKLVMDLSRHRVIVADWRKDSPFLGGGLWTQGVPIEVIPCTASYVQQVLTKSFPTTSISLRLGGTAKAGPLVTDNSNFILDVVFTSEAMKDPKEMVRELQRVTGIVEVGLFVDSVEEVYFGMEDGTVVRRIKDGFEP